MLPTITIFPDRLFIIPGATAYMQESAPSGKQLPRCERMLQQSAFIVGVKRGLRKELYFPLTFEGITCTQRNTPKVFVWKICSTSVRSCSTMGAVAAMPVAHKPCNKALILHCFAVKHCRRLEQARQGTRHCLKSAHQHCRQGHLCSLPPVLALAHSLPRCSDL